MAPRKRVAEEAHEEKAAVAVPPGRVTRSSIRRASEPPPSPAQQKKKAKMAEPREKGAKAKKVGAEKGNGVSEIHEDEAEKKKVTTTKTVVIEHCKQCQSFKRRAEEVKKGLEKGISGITVVFNPEKPRRGCFEIREEGGEKFITLLDLKRPFKAMKDLDMEQVTKDIIGKMK